MADKGKAPSSSSLEPQQEVEVEFMYGGDSGWVEARTSCDHLNLLSSDLSQIPTPDTSCNRCGNLVENWLCLCCKDVLCSRFVNKHMLEHYQERNHCLVLSYSDLSVWCFSCDAYLDAQLILQLRPVYETAYLLKFGESETSTLMADKGKAPSSSSLEPQQEVEEEFMYGGDSGWVEARTSCDHLNLLSSDLSQIPTPDTSCNRCGNLVENWLCLCCKDVLCSRFVNKHMLQHYQERNHCLGLSYSDLSVWCFSCDAYLDAQVILQLRPVYETAYLLKFGESPPIRTSGSV